MAVIGTEKETNKNKKVLTASPQEMMSVSPYPRAPQLEETPERPPSSRAEGLLFLHGLESNPGSSLQTEEEAGLP